MWGLLCDASGKEPTCLHRRYKRLGFHPWAKEDPLEEEMTTHSNILAWEIAWTGYSSWGCKESNMTEVTEHTCVPAEWE